MAVSKAYIKISLSLETRREGICVPATLDILIVIGQDYYMILAKLTVPISISRLFKLNSDVYNYNTRQANHIHSFKGNNEFIYRTFKFQSVYIWNIILQNININVYFPTFKHLLKRFLLNNNTSVRYDK